MRQKLSLLCDFQFGKLVASPHHHPPPWRLDNAKSRHQLGHAAFEVVPHALNVLGLGAL